MMEREKVCGTCRWHKKVMPDNGWGCTCFESEFYGDWSEYSDRCEEWEGRKCEEYRS